jgi:hypothetical protein
MGVADLLGIVYSSLLTLPGCHFDIVYFAYSKKSIPSQLHIIVAEVNWFRAHA